MLVIAPLSAPLAVVSALLLFGDFPAEFAAFFFWPSRCVAGVVINPTWLSLLLIRSSRPCDYVSLPSTLTEVAP